MSSLSELLPPRQAPELKPALSERRSDAASRTANDDDFSRRLERERTSDTDRNREPDRARGSERDDQRTDERAASRSEAPSDTSSSRTAERTPKPVKQDEPIDRTEASENQTSVNPDSDDNNDASTNPAVTPSSQTTTAQSLAELGLVDLTKDDAPALATDLTVTALSGDAISLTPPTQVHNAQTQPGALGRWFGEASGPAALAAQNTGPAANMAGLLNGQPKGILGPDGQSAKNGGTTAPGQTSANMAASGTPNGQGLTSPLATSLASDGNPASMSFADSLAASNTQNSSLQNTGLQDFVDLVSQAANKTPGTGEIVSAPTLTGQNIATAAQPAGTGVPQSSTGQAVPVTALAVEITRQAGNGKTQFDIRLDPPELGRLNVRLEVDANGQTRTHLVVERSETLDMLASDARTLERALQQAGLKTEPGSVTFELAQDAGDNLAGQDQNANANKDDNPSTQNEDGTGADLTSASSEEAALPSDAVRQRLYLTGQLDVRV